MTRRHANCHSSGVRDWLKRSLRQAAWAPLLVFLGWALAALAGLYKTYLWLDKPTHFVGGFALAYFFAACLKQSQRWVGPIPTLIQRASCIALAATGALAWEFYEYFSDVVLGTHMNHGVADTLSDLLFSVVGAASFALLEPLKRVLHRRSFDAPARFLRRPAE